ncbi:tRNA (adenosine(37)-N6)-threonylcarbamoyltransferase complex ATPase subunit type 1 TsaE [Sulfitobacter aestuariivivens]|uniref:tRNA threonylcarbamoyladenosine biosynthesis protein TsaE n=1 Tax=Sulfitobacter aestuariivivens TaxID=2766981 RepID=A0A927D588_9RHOB|nr:tRNA (adenosine(37)-N6)-threonylcarbamoyltransferase complex ATPase subunit type 1 TsaE [Sulfitobacter aestuariivivens]MBD3665209.1 tRNA (adenosine(37)-N6)-threonylcarbamoyltransferase complex ATPase subunit type 1 TsaE [Sulfitobacter aestuariivivens]
MSHPALTIHLQDAEATDQIARALGQRLQVGDVVLLQGPVGAGKSHFARSLIRSLLKEPEDVPSPTFTLVQTYETVSGAIWHADLYRLSDIQEVEELGLVDAFETAICLIEWPDRLGTLTPESALRIDLVNTDDPDERVLSAEWSDKKWEERLEGWSA